MKGEENQHIVVSNEDDDYVLMAFEVEKSIMKWRDMKQLKVERALEAMEVKGGHHSA